MTNSMAKSDIKRLRRDGIEVTDDDVIALNDCANALSRESLSNEIVHAPRIGWANSTPIHEPTQQSEVWCTFYASKWFDCQPTTLERLTSWLFRRQLPSMAYARAFALANARTVGFFDGLKDRQKAVEAVTRWVIGLDCTDSELMTACLYATNGESIESESSEALDAVRTELFKNRQPSCPYTKIIEDAIECGIGLPIAELKAMTAGELYRITSRYCEFKIASSGVGKLDKNQIKKALHDAKFSEYILLLAEIRKQGTK